MFGNLGFSEILLIAVIALLLFGPNKLPELGRSLGRTLREFKQGTRELLEDDPRTAERKDVTPPNSSSEKESEQPQPAPPDHRQDSRRLPD